jgi:flagellar biosynthesis/type III secretory pathway M-ring protein FliF/YscJ
MVIVQYVCAFILLWLLVKAAWPDTSKRQADAARKQQAHADRKHTELQAAIKKLERESAAPARAPLPTYNSAERARVLALGKIKDGDMRHPILDAPCARVANSPN